MNKIVVLFSLVCAAQRSFTMRVSDLDREDTDYGWKTKEALREYLNFLLGGLRREEVELGIPWSSSGGARSSYTGQDEEPEMKSPLYSRHRPQNFHMENYNGPRGRDPEGFYRKLLMDHFYNSPPNRDEDDMEAVDESRESSNFAVPPSDPRFFETPSPFHDEDEPRDETTVTKKEVEDVTENTAVDLKNLEKMKLFPYNSDEAAEIEQGEDVTAQLIDIEANKENIILIALVAGCSTGVIAGIALMIYGFIKLQRNAKATADVEYPAYGVTGPNKESTPTGDRRLAHSAQMYHYQLTKQQIIAMESSRGGTGERRGSLSEADSEDDNEEGDYTVYECPGLAPAGEMEVKNPLFQDDPTPATNADQSEVPTEQQHPKDDNDAK